MSILAVATGLFSIHQPYIDHWSWRQSDVAAIARNFSQNNFHFARPHYAERKGLHFPERDGIYDGYPLDSAQLIADLEQLRSRGATYLVFTANTS